MTSASPSTSPISWRARRNPPKFCRKTGPSGAFRSTPTLTVFAAGDWGQVTRGATRIPDAREVRNTRRSTTTSLLQAHHVEGLDRPLERSEEHTSEHQSLMRIPYAVFCLKKKKH